MMEKWVRRTLVASVGAGVVALCTTSLANADGTPVGTPGVESGSTAALGLADDVVSAVGVGSLDGLTNLAGLGHVADFGGADAKKDADHVAGTANSVGNSPVTAELNENTEIVTETAELNSSDPVATTYADGGDEGAVVAPETQPSSTSVAGDGSMGSGSSLSASVSAPATGNDASVAGIGAGVDVEKVTGVPRVVGTASALLG